MIVSGSVPPEPCGVGDHAARLARELGARKGVEVAVLTSAWIEPERQGSAEVFPIVRDNTFASLRDALRKMKEWQPDVVHFQYPTQGYRHWGRALTLMPAAAWLQGRKVVFTWHEPVRIRPHTIPHILLPGGVILVRPNYRDLMGAWFRILHFIKDIRYVTNGSAFPMSSLSKDARADLRKELMGEKERLVLYFGFAYAQKGVDQVFEIADPTRDRLILCYRIDEGDIYQREIARLASSGAWAGNARLMGFLPERQMADLLAVADAVVLPFREGSGPWNTSALAVRDQGSLLVTTSREKSGYVAQENTYYALPGDVTSMRAGLSAHIGSRHAPGRGNGEVWRQLTDAHVDLYEAVLGMERPVVQRVQR
ncbi:MAG: glycosyltransferase family 4 protein [Hyphomicrobiaceae bacterium]|nr:MAG: glycosyltransferase family 4 protein [Hyphomicrobiaceae bacterium]